MKNIRRINCKIEILLFSIDLRHVYPYIEKLEEVEVFHQLIGQQVNRSL